MKTSVVSSCLSKLSSMVLLGLGTTCVYAIDCGPYAAFLGQKQVTLLISGCSSQGMPTLQYYAVLP